MLFLFFSGTHDWRFEEWQKLPSQSFTFKNLQPFTTYKFAINLKTEHGIVYNGTHYAKTTTMPAMPTKPNIFQISQSSTNVIIRWAKPSTTNGPLKNYIIEMIDITSGAKNIWETEVIFFLNFPGSFYTYIVKIFFLEASL